MNKKQVLAIVGPTGVGKTALSIQLAKQLNGEIISGDSMQVYKKLDVGTAKITTNEMAGIPHYLIDILDVHESYSASDFQKQAQVCIEDIIERGKLPIVVGGSGLYIEGLLGNLTFGGENSSNDRIRQHWQQVLEKKGVDFVYESLYQKDPTAAQAIGMGNPRRLIRALEVIDSTGKLFSKQVQQEQPYDCLIIGLNTDRELLYERINQRVDIMIQNGLIEEVQWLYEQQLPNTALSMKAIGYKELFGYVKGNATLEESLELLKQQSRRYAKRQLTWFKNRMTVQWFDLVTDKNGNVYKQIIEEVSAWKK